jgi:hypothetical protein
MKNEFYHGPFRFEPLGDLVFLGGIQCQKWGLFYANKKWASDFVEITATRTAIRNEFEEVISAWIREAREKDSARRVHLVTPGGAVLCTARLSSLPEGVSSCIPDDRFPFWLITDTTPTRGMPVTLGEWTRIAKAHSAPRLFWITDVLPGAVLTHDVGVWRPPTPFEIRHVVGEGSLTGVAGDCAAAKVGMTPQNFRKYLGGTQKMPFAVWHLLLNRLEVQQ